MILGVALLVRVVPMIVFPQGDCMRDECIYRSIAQRILEGQGLTTTSKGWLPAPGYPYFLALMKGVFGAFFVAKIFQVPMSLVSTWAMYRIGWRLEGRKLGLMCAWLFALHPTLAFFTSTLWIETVYVMLLLLAVNGVLWAREADVDWRRGLGPGLALGVATLFRGVATYLWPIFALALIWPDEREGFLEGLGSGLRRRWKHVLAMALGWVMMVGPYSAAGTSQHGGFMLTDATLGHVMFLGNNDFPPLTFDYGNGMLTPGLYAKWLRVGRRPCDRNQPPVVSSKCEVDLAQRWIRQNPDRFVERIPDRVAQQLNPHSFLTRHIRWGYWSGSWLRLPWYAKELLVVLVMLTSYLVILGGTLAAWSRARGPYAVMAVGTVLYTFATISILYGMTRFRLPLEPLWMVYLAMMLVDPKKTWQSLQESNARAAGALLTLPALFALSLRYLPTGFPAWW